MPPPPRPGTVDCWPTWPATTVCRPCRSKYLANADGSADGNAAGADGQGDGQGDAAGAGGAQANGNGAGAADGSGAAGGNGAGSGPASGAGSGGRPGGSGSGRASGFGGPSGHLRMDQKKLDELAKLSKERGKVTGTTLPVQGVAGNTSRVETSSASVVAAVLGPSTPPQMQVKDGDPFQPAFKTIRFTSIPYLNSKFTIDGNFDKWKTIPAFDLLPEKFDGTHLAGLRVEQKLSAKMAWDRTGLYFYVNVIDPNQHLDMPSGPTSFWVGDVEEVWIDMLNSKERFRALGVGQQFWCWPFGTSGDPTLTGGESVMDRVGWHAYPMGPAGMLRAAKDRRWIRSRIRNPRRTPQGRRAHRRQDHRHESQRRDRLTTAILLGQQQGRGDLCPARHLGRRHARRFRRHAGNPREAHRRRHRRRGPRNARNSFIIGEPFRLRVTDRDMNLNPDYRDKIAVTVRNERASRPSRFSKKPRSTAASSKERSAPVWKWERRSPRRCPSTTARP